MRVGGWEGPHQLEGEGDGGDKMQSELEEKWLLELRAALHGRTELGTAPGTATCPSTLHSCLCHQETQVHSLRKHASAHLALQAPQPGSRATPGRKPGLLSGSFYSTRKKQSPRPLPWPFPPSRMFFPRILIWSTPSPPSFYMDDTFP